MAADKLTPKYELLIDGGAAPAAVMENLISISVKQDLVLADTIEVRLSNDDFFVTENHDFDEGKSITVKLGYVETDIQIVATGTIARRECDFPERGPAVCTVIAYDKRFILKHGVHTKAWTDVKDSDVVQQLAQAAGLQVDVDATDVTHKYLFQPALTDLAFIAERGYALGYITSLDRENKKLSFKKPDPGEAADLTLAWGETLFSFRPRFTTSNLCSKVTVRGWDMAAKKEVKGKATLDDLDSAMGLSSLGGDRAKKAYGEREVVLTAAVNTEAEAKDMAKAYMNQTLHEFGTGEGSAQGENKIMPGTVIDVDGLGGRASGRYFVTSAFHHYEHRGYTTYFEFLRPGESPERAPPPKQAPPPQQRPPSDGFDAKVDHFDSSAGGSAAPAKSASATTTPDATASDGAAAAEAPAKPPADEAPAESAAEKATTPTKQDTAHRFQLHDDWSSEPHKSIPVTITTPDGKVVAKGKTDENGWVQCNVPEGMQQLRFSYTPEGSDRPIHRDVFVTGADPESDEAHLTHLKNMGFCHEGDTDSQVIASFQAAHPELKITGKLDDDTKSAIKDIVEHEGTSMKDTLG